MNWLDTLREKHGDGPALWDAAARALHRANATSRGAEPDFDKLPVEQQERLLDRAIRLTA